MLILPSLQVEADTLVEEEDKEGCHYKGYSVHYPQGPRLWEEDQIVANEGEDVED